MDMGMEMLAAGVQRRAASLWYICGDPFWSRDGPAAWRYAIKAVTALALALKVWLRYLACFPSTLHELCNSQLQGIKLLIVQLWHTAAHDCGI